MNLGLELHPNAPGLACAAAALVAGAPLFSDGLRAVRLRRHLSRLRSAKLSEYPSGFVHVTGRVALEGPMFAPLSNRPCAGWRLELRASNMLTRATVDERRSFRLTDGELSASVTESGARWDLAVTAEREVESDEALSEHLNALLARAPEVAWARTTGAKLHLVERALLAGAECHVIGYARHGRPLEIETEEEWLRTGTDGGAVVTGTADRATSGEPDLWIGAGEHLDFLLVTDRTPDPLPYLLPAWRMLGAAAGPVLGLAGLTYLASALDWLRAQGAP
ncbi:MAG: hypothetical protein HYR73_07065 [Candidatus Eisenbacteria bacterium]|nr:hypothetical protein [Candidatus Eisenbacteria bacterium]